MLGFPFMSLFFIELNYPMRRITIHPLWHDPYGVEIPFSQTPDSLLLLNHQGGALPTMLWLVDTRRRRSQISYALAKAVNLTPNPPLVPTPRLCGDGEKVPVGWRRMSSYLGGNRIRLSQLTYLVPACPQDPRLRELGGALGTDILASFVVTIDYKRGRMVFGFDPHPHI